MSNFDGTTDLLDAISKVLLRATMLGFLLLLIWFGGWLLAPGMLNLSGRWFDLSPHELNLVHFTGLALAKMCVLLFFLFPYISLRLVVRSRALAR